MAHIDKFSRQELRRVLKETYREYDDPDKYENDVDPSRTHLNYSMRFKSSYEFMQALDDRVTDLINNTMGGKAPKLEPKFVSWVMTAPKCLHDDDAKLKLFFTEFYKFCQERYGKDNVIDGVVHMDETSPHMTVYIVPECISRKSGKPTISAATRFQRNELRMFHSDFDKVCEKLFGQPNLVVRTEEERLADPKNLTLRELKASQTLAEAETKAQELVADAQRNADAIVRQAEAKMQEATKKIQEAEKKWRIIRALPLLTVDQAKVVSITEETGTFGMKIDEYDRKHWNDEMDTPLVKRAKWANRPLPDTSNIKQNTGAEYQR
jgi:hypothetical protein